MKTTLSIYDITCTVLSTSHVLYMICHLLCVISHSGYVWLLTMTISMTSHTLCLWHIYFIWHDTQCHDNTTIVYFTATMSDITLTVSVASHPMYQFYQTPCMYDITSTICMKSYVIHMTSHPLFMSLHHFIYDIKFTISDLTSTISDLKSTVSVSSHPLYRWYHIHHM